mmetsp:Transcript_36106/g.66184  ORF Transcript_36106/g.66184 Transcript_36106/m.66184 type:complete len:143 (-) Transcript_36106:301-729(-)
MRHDDLAREWRWLGSAAFTPTHVQRERYIENSAGSRMREIAAAARQQPPTPQHLQHQTNPQLNNPRHCNSSHPSSTSTRTGTLHASVCLMKSAAMWISMAFGSMDVSPSLTAGSQIRMHAATVTRILRRSSLSMGKKKRASI